MTWRGSVVAALCLPLLVGACGGSADDTSGGDDELPSIAAEVIQLRRDELLERVEIAVENTGRDEVVVERIRLRVKGFRSAGGVAKDSPVPAGQVVNLPTPYGEVRCSRDGTARVGRPVVTIWLHTTTDPRSRRVVLMPRDTGVLSRIADSACTARLLAAEVDVRFGPDWRQKRVPRDVEGDAGADAGGVVLHGTLEATLRTDEPRDLTQVAGTVIYSLRPQRPVVDGPLAALTPEDPVASVPVSVSVSRCDGHARGETKKPYAFLVWLAPPGGEETAVNPVVDEAARAAFQAVCPL